MDKDKELSIEKKVKEILGKYVSDIVTPSASLKEDLGLSSFDYVEILFDIEDAFKLEIPEDDIKDATTVKDIIEYLKERVDVQK